MNRYAELHGTHKLLIKPLKTLEKNKFINHSQMHFGTSSSHFPDLVQVSVSFPSRINPSSQKIVAFTVPPFDSSFT